MAKEIDILKRKIRREQLARMEAEDLLEEKSLALFKSNEKLKALNHTLSLLVDDQSTKLKKRELEYKALVESINDIICKTDLDGLVTFINPIGLLTIGYKTEELIGKSIFSFLAKRDRKRAHLYYKQQIRRGNCSSYTEIALQTAQREDVWLGVNIQFFADKCITCYERMCALKEMRELKADETCKFKEVIIVARDITEIKSTQELLNLHRRKLEKGLKQQELLSEVAAELNLLAPFEQRINTIIRNIGLQIKAQDIFIYEDNKAGSHAHLRFEWSKVGFLPINEQYHELAYKKFPSLKDTLTKEGVEYKGVSSSFPDDVRTFFAKLNLKYVIVFPIIVEGKTIGFIGFHQSNTLALWTKSEFELLRAVSSMLTSAYERRHMENSLIKERDNANTANKAKSEFLANMSHEIRTPMNAILGFSEALYQRLESGQEKEMVRSVLGSGKLLLSLLNDILDLSKIEAGKMKFQPESVDIRHLLNEMLQLFQYEAQRKSLALSLNIDTTCPEVLVFDENRIKQVCFNLVGNAIKFTEKGYVDIAVRYESTEDRKGTFIIIVKDSGVGMSASQLGSIFKPFEQQSGQANRKYGGAGLGLAIALRLVERMKGTIKVKSAIKIGSQFTVSIPNIERAADAQSSINHISSNENISFGKAQILLVDDVASNVDILQLFLAAHDVVITIATSGEKALEILNRKSVQMIILDIRLPGIDGFEVARNIKQNTQVPHPPIIAYTASAFFTKQVEASSDFDDLLCKPVKYADLLTSLKRFLPYERKDQAPAIVQNKPVSIELSADLRRQLPEIVRHLKVHFKPTWLELRDHYILFQIESFGQDLLQYGNDTKLNYIINYAQLILNDIERIDLENLKNHLQLFDDLIKCIDNEAHQ